MPRELTPRRLKYQRLRLRLRLSLFAFAMMLRKPRSQIRMELNHKMVDKLCGLERQGRRRWRRIDLTNCRGIDRYIDDIVQICIGFVTYPANCSRYLCLSLSFFLFFTSVVFSISVTILIYYTCSSLSPSQRFTLPFALALFNIEVSSHSRFL